MFPTHLALRKSFAALGVVAAFASSARVADARQLVFAETWQNGTTSWRTTTNNGGDCKGWPVCPYAASQLKASFPAALKPNDIIVRDHDGAGNRDAAVCNGKYVHIAREHAGWEAGNVVATGGVTHGGIPYANAQFRIALGDRLCMVAWIRAYQDQPVGTEAGPYIGINYTGAHGVVDAGHNHGTHYVIGSMGYDPAHLNGWVNTPRNSYGAMTQTIRDGKWHRYTAAFTVDSKDIIGPRNFSPEFPATTTWATADRQLYGQPRLSLFGKSGDRNDSPAFAPTLENGADFGDVYVYKAAAGDASPCPSEAELDALAFASDKTECGEGTVCKTAVAALPAGDNTPARPGNVAYYCAGCSEPFGAAPSDTTCGENKPFCTQIGRKGGTCTACSGDAESTLDAATRCGAASPTCNTAGPNAGSCGKCTSDEACVNPGAEAAHVGPSCNTTTGACFFCRSDNGVGAPETACSGTAPRCDTATGQCGACHSNSDCGGDAGVHGGPFCNVETGACATCNADFGAALSASTCPAATPHCTVSGDQAGICGACSTNADCSNASGATTHAGPICDTGKGLCGACDGDAEVSTSALGCTSPAAPTCSANGACGKCASDEDCKNPTGVRLHARASCNVALGVCEGAPAPVVYAGEGGPGAAAGGGNAEAAASGCQASGQGNAGLLGLLFAMGATLLRRKKSRAV